MVGLKYITLDELKDCRYNVILLDTGYHLSLMVGNDTQENIKAIEEFVSEHIQDSKLKSKNGKNLVFILPFEGSQISAFLTKLEEDKRRLTIENLSLTLTTLEDVFLR